MLFYLQPPLSRRSSRLGYLPAMYDLLRRLSGSQVCVRLTILGSPPLRFIKRCTLSRSSTDQRPPHQARANRLELSTLVEDLNHGAQKKQYKKNNVDLEFH